MGPSTDAERAAIAAGGLIMEVGEAGEEEVRVLRQKLDDTASQPPMLLDTTSQGRFRDKPRWSPTEWATRKRRRKMSAQTKRRNR